MWRALSVYEAILLYLFPCWASPFRADWRVQYQVLAISKQCVHPNEYRQTEMDPPKINRLCIWFSIAHIIAESQQYLTFCLLDPDIILFLSILIVPWKRDFGGAIMCLML